MTSIQAPTNCPSCSSELVWSNHILYCLNELCGSKVAKRIEHFAKTLKIKGLGPASIAKLDLTDLQDVYHLTVEHLADALSSQKVAEKLYAEIENSKKAPLNLVLPAFSIPLIGKTATDKLSTICDSIYELNEDTCKRAGIGPKATQNLLDWYETEFVGWLDSLPFSFRFDRKKAVSTTGVVCISGKLTSFKTKAEATEALTSLGYEVKSSVTKDVTILVNESGIESTKTKKARESGVTIVTNLSEFLGEH